MDDGLDEGIRCMQCTNRDTIGSVVKLRPFPHGATGTRLDAGLDRIDVTSIHTPAAVLMSTLWS